MKSLTISRKIALGFGALILLTGALGGLAVSSMWSVQTAARTLASEYVPETDVVGNLKSHLASANLAIRSYGLTADAAYLAEARQQLAVVHEDLKAAQKLSAAHPDLVRLHEDLGPLVTLLKNYEQAVDATEARNTDMTATRTRLNEAAASFLASLDQLIETQKARLASEINSGKDVAALQERVRKLTLAWEIRHLGNLARVAVFKAQALREVTLFNDSLKNFPPMDERFTELFGLLKVQRDIDDLNIVKASAAAYRTAVQTTFDDTVALSEIGKVRLDAATKLISLADDAQHTGMRRTIEAAESSDKRLALSSSTILGGSAFALLVGVLVAGLMIRSTTRVLTTVADSLNESSVQVTAAASQVAAASQTLAEGASEQAASLEETSASLEEMSSMTRRNADSAQQAKELSHLTRSSADVGAGHMQQMRVAMDAIKASSSDIAKIIKTIDEIAFQTNILALNAAVEAARAGEAGMGFAVVAEEVRNLAQRSAHAARETAEKIEDAIRKSEQGVSISSRVAASLTEIVEKARRMDALVGEIATASAEQSQGIGQLNTAVSQMDKVTQSNASGAEESASAAEELNAQAVAMQQAVVELRRLVSNQVQSASPASAESAPDRPAIRPQLLRPRLASHQNGHNAPGHSPATPARPTVETTSQPLTFSGRAGLNFAMSVPDINGHDSDHFRSI